MTFNFGNWLSGAYKTVANTIAPVINPIKGVVNTAIKIPMSVFQSTGAISQNLLKAGVGLSSSLSSLLSGNAIYWIGGLIVVGGVVYYVSNRK